MMDTISWTKPVPVWEWLGRNGLWYAYDENTNELIEFAKENNKQHVRVGDFWIDLNYMRQLTEDSSKDIRDIRRTCLDPLITRPNTHGHCLYFQHTEDRVTKCSICGVKVRKYYGCSSCKFFICLACVIVGDEYPHHNFESNIMSTVGSSCYCCTKLLSIGNGLECVDCGFILRKNCYLDVSRRTRCPRSKKTRDELVRICTILPKTMKEPINKYYIFWRQAGLGYYFFGPGVDSRYIVGRIEGSSVTLLSSLKQFKSAKAMTISIWDSFCKSEIRVQFLVQSTLYFLVQGLKLLPTAIPTKTARNYLDTMVGCIDVISKFRSTDSNFTSSQINSVRGLIVGMTLVHQTPELDATLFDLSLWPTSFDTILPLSIIKQISSEHVDTLSKHLSTVCYSRYAVAYMWETLFFRYIIGILPVPGLKLCYSTIRLLFYAWRGDVQEVIRSAIGMISGLLAIITLFGVELGIDNLFTTLADTNETLHALFLQLKDVIGDVLQCVKPIDTFYTFLNQQLSNVTETKLLQTIASSAVEKCLKGLESAAIYTTTIWTENRVTKALSDQVDQTYKIQLPCEKWKNQMCPDGDNCKYLHVDIDTVIDRFMVDTESIQNDSIPKVPIKSKIPPAHAWFYEDSKSKRWKLYSFDQSEILEIAYVNSCLMKCSSSKVNDKIINFGKDRILIESGFFQKDEIRRGTWFFEEEENYFVPYLQKQADLLESAHQSDDFGSVVVTPVPKLRYVIAITDGYRQFRQSENAKPHGRIVIRGFDKLLQFQNNKEKS